MAVSLATTLQKLEGSAHELGGIRVRFDESPNGRPAAWAGGEGYAAPVHVQDVHPHFLKIFRLPSNERRMRAAFLSALDLGRVALGAPSAIRPKGHRPFEAAPTRTVRAVIRAPDDGDIPIEGHLAPSVPGKSLSGRLQAGWDPSLDVRAKIAWQLCSAIEVLEGAGLTHGDLSADNVMIADDADGADLRLIDFDGFHHERVPPVPYTPKEKGGRAWGTPGYRAPAFKRGPDVVVTSDRVSLAILAMEIVTMRHDDDLQRDTFLEQKDIDAGTPQLPEEVTERWPAGWQLVQRASAADHPSRAPSPAEIRREIQRLRGDVRAQTMFEMRGPMSTSAGFLVLVRQAGKQDRQVKLRTGRGSFALVSPELGWLGYELGAGTVRVRGESPVVDGRPTPLFHRRGGPKANAERHDGAIDLEAKLGDVLICDEQQVYLG